jgi:hypothetical protein
MAWLGLDPHWFRSFFEPGSVGSKRILVPQEHVV